MVRGVDTKKVRWYQEADDDEAQPAGRRKSGAKTTPESSPYHDGQGLYLQVHEGTDGERYRSWFFRYKLTDGSQWGKQKYKGLGSIEVISLAAACTLVKELRRAQALAKVRNQPWDPVGESRKANAESKMSRSGERNLQPVRREVHGNKPSPYKRVIGQA